MAIPAPLLEKIVALILAILTVAGVNLSKDANPQIRFYQQEPAATAIPKPQPGAAPKKAVTPAPKVKNIADGVDLYPPGTSKGMHLEKGGPKGGAEVLLRREGGIQKIRLFDEKGRAVMDLEEGHPKEDSKTSRERHQQGYTWSKDGKYKRGKAQPLSKDSEKLWDKLAELAKLIDE